MCISQNIYPCTKFVERLGSQDWYCPGAKKGVSSSQLDWGGMNAGCLSHQEGSQTKQLDGGYQNKNFTRE